MERYNPITRFHLEGLYLVDDRDTCGYMPGSMGNNTDRCAARGKPQAEIACRRKASAPEFNWSFVDTRPSNQNEGGEE